MHELPGFACGWSWRRCFGAACLLSLTACSGSDPVDPPASGVQSEIVGGTVAQPTGGGFVAALFQDFDGELRHICGGTFIAEDVVVTAAHCSFGSIESAELHQVVTGPTDPMALRVARRPASLAAVGPSDLLEVESVYVNPNFDPVSRDSDIAVWKLAGGSPGKTLSLASVSFTNSTEALEKVVRAFGYGTTDPASPETSDVLRRVNVPMVPAANCRSLLYEAFGGASQPRLPEEIVTNNMICAGTEGKGSCLGDDGGPLSINQVLLGVTSWGLGCGEPAQPHVYTRVARFRQWITACAGAGCDRLTETTTTCVDGFTDCDGDPANGCETSGSDCGGCEGDCNCDVISPNEPAAGYEPCAPGDTCLPVFETATAAPTSVCTIAGSAGIGESCLVDGEPAPQACAAGLRCEFGQCLPWCDLALDDCPGDLTCVAYPYPSAVSVTGRQLGVCFDGVLAQDDFSDPDSGWYEWQAVRPLVDVGYSYGDYGYESFRMSSESHQYTAWDSIGPSNGANMVVEVDVGGFSTYGQWSGKAVVICRNYWFQLNSSGQARIAIRNPNYDPCFYCRPGDPYCSQQDCDNSSRSDLGLTAWVTTDAIHEDVNHITASCIGNSPVVLTLTVDGQLVLEFEESVHNYVTGWAGLGVTHFGLAYFDNYFVWEP